MKINLNRSRVLIFVIVALLIFLSVVVLWVHTAPSRPIDYAFSQVITNLQFIDGGIGNDKILATVLNTADSTIEITKGSVNDQTVELCENVSIKKNSEETVTLTMPTDSLIPGKQYSIRLATNAGDLSTSPIMRNERYTFYHMYHPNSIDPIEEGVITDLNAFFYTANYGDGVSGSIQNTGDTAIVITGGFVNGMAAINVTDSRYHITGIAQCHVEKNSTGYFDLNFPPASLYNLKQPFNVKLVTAEGNIIEYPDVFYYPFGNYTGIQIPVVTAEHMEITSAQHSEDGLIRVTIKNLDTDSIQITSGIVNGKAASVADSILLVPGGAERIATLIPQAAVSDSSPDFQVVLITSHNSGFIYNGQ